MVKPLRFLLLLLSVSLPLLSQSQGWEFDSLSTLQCEQAIKDIELDHSGNRLFIYQEGEVWIYQVNREKYKRISVELKDSITYPYYQVRFSPDGKYLAFFNLDDGIMLYKKLWGKYRFYDLFTLPNRVSTVDINHENQLVTGGPYGELSLWDIRRKKQIKAYKVDHGKGAIYTVHFVENSLNHIVCGTGASKVILFDLKRDSILSDYKIDKKFQPDPSVVWASAIPSYIFQSQKASYWIHIFNRSKHLLKWSSESHLLKVLPLDMDISAFSSFQDHLILGTASGEVFVQRQNALHPTHQLNSRLSKIEGIIISENSGFLIAWDNRGKLQVWKRRLKNKTQK